MADNIKTVGIGMFHKKTAGTGRSEGKKQGAGGKPKKKNLSGRFGVSEPDFVNPGSIKTYKSQETFRQQPSFLSRMDPSFMQLEKSARSSLSRKNKDTLKLPRDTGKAPTPSKMNLKRKSTFKSFIQRSTVISMPTLNMNPFEEIKKRKTAVNAFFQYGRSQAHGDSMEYRSATTDDTLLNLLNGLESLKDQKMLFSQEWTNIPDQLHHDCPAIQYWIYGVDLDLLYSATVVYTQPSWVKTFTRFMCTGLSSSVTISVLDPNFRTSIKVEYVPRSRHKTEIWGRSQVIGYLKIKKTANKIDISIQNHREDTKFELSASSRGWPGEVHIFQLSDRLSSGRRETMAEKTALSALSAGTAGSMEKFRGPIATADTSRLNGWGSRLKIKTETIALKFPDGIKSEMKACLLAAMFVLDTQKSRRHTRLTKF